MNIKHTELLFLVLLIPVMIWLLIFSYKKIQRTLTLMASFEKLKVIFPYISRSRTILKSFLVFTAFIMFLLALISPRWGYEWVEVESKGTNIMVAIDVSRSMLATDIQPSRLSRAKFEVNKLIDKLQGDRLGLIVFAGDAYLQCPLTHDYMMVSDWLSSVDVNSISSPGTSIKAALEVADKAFSSVKSEAKALIIISDGEEQDKETLNMAKQLKASGVNIYTIAVGTQEGSPIELPNGELLKDKNGNIVISKLDDKFLKEIAEIGGGYSVRSTSGDFHLNQLYYDHLKKKLGDEVVKSGKTRKWYETYQIFMAIGFVALLFELLLSFRFGFLDFMKKIFAKKSKSRKNLLMFLFLFFATNQEAKANIFDWRLWNADYKMTKQNYSDARYNYEQIRTKDAANSRVDYNLGVALYRQENYEKAEQIFSEATKKAKTKALKEKAFYNLGDSQFKQENYEDAIKSYEAALKLDAKDKDAEFNLNLAKKLLQEKKDDKNKDDKNKNNKDKNKDKKDQDKNQQNKDQDKDKDNKSDESKGKNKNQEQKQNKPKPKAGALSPADIDRILKQVDEADPRMVRPLAPKPQPGKQLNPW